MSPPLAIATTAPPEPRARRLMRDLRWITIAWVFGSMWLWTASGATWTDFGKAIGANDRIFAIFAAIPFVGALFQLPVGFYMERYGHRRAIFLIFGIGGRLMWVLLALIPWVLPGLKPLWWQAAVLVLLLGQAALNATGPPWNGWMADVVPRRVRGRYFSLRNRVGQFVGVVSTLVIGALLDHYEYMGPHTMLVVTSTLLGAAGILGAMDIMCFHNIRDDYPQRIDHRTDFARSVGSVLRNREFRYYLAFNFIYTLGLGFIAQFIWLYARDVVKMSNQQSNLLIVAFPLIIMVISYPFWGRVLDHVGKKPTLIVASTIVMIGSVGWVLIGPDAAAAIHWRDSFAALRHGHFGPLLADVFGAHWHWTSRIGYALIVISTFAQPGIDLSSFNILLDFSAARDKQSGGPSYPAVNAVVVAIGGVLSAALAGLAAWLIGKEWRLAVPLLGIVLTYHGVLFLGSTLLRLAAIPLAFKFHEPRAAGTREAIAHVTDSLYNNTREAILLPTRMVGQVARWTYKLDYRRLDRCHEAAARPV